MDKKSKVFSEGNDIKLFGISAGNMQYRLSKQAIAAAEKVLSKGKAARLERTKAGLKVLELSTKVEFLGKTKGKTLE